MLKKFLIFSWILALGLLFLYSFTQVDLGLTLNRSSIITDIQKSFQYIGYFNRPLSALLVSIIFISLFALYLWTLFLTHKKKIGLKTIWILVILSAGILLFSYNAFSYDLFNYMFDAKIVTNYGENPYIKKALDFAGDPYLGFMHWTHRTYPYGPLWLGITIPLSFAGLQIFIVTFYLFKLLMVGAYLLCAYFIYKIAKQTKLVSSSFALAFFALNPLVLVEGLVSSHHELVMMGLTLMGVYFLFAQKYIRSWVFLLLSVGIKFATLFLAPLFLWYPFSKMKNKQEVFLMGSVLIMIIAVIFASNRTTFQPWYILFIIPFAALVSHKYYISIPAAVISFLVLFQYVPFLYTGNFDPPIPTLMSQMLTAAFVLAALFTIGFAVFKKVHSK